MYDQRYKPLQLIMAYCRRLYTCNHVSICPYIYFILHLMSNGVDRSKVDGNTVVDGDEIEVGTLDDDRIDMVAWLIY